LEVQVLSRPPFFLEPKPQQTGTRLLIGYGEVATTSGSTSLRPLGFGSASQFVASWCNSSMPGFGPDGLGANPSEAASFNLPFWIYDLRTDKPDARKSSFVNRKFRTPGGEIASRLAYTQKSREQNLPGRPAFALRATARRANSARVNRHS
jgi:hypothetical protein